MAFKKVDSITLFLTVTIFCCLLIFLSLLFFGFDLKYKIIGQILICIVLVFYVFFYRLKIFLPFIFIPFSTLIYGFLGGINFIERGAEVDFYNELYFLLFVFSMMFSYSLLVLATKKRPFRGRSGIAVSKGVLSIITYLIIFSGLASVLVDWIQIGNIPLFNTSDNRTESKPFLRLFFIISIFFAYYKFSLKPSVKNKVLLAVFVLLALFSGYRTSVFFMLIILFFRATKTDYFLKHFKKFLIVFALLFFCVNLIKLYRDLNKYGEQHYYEIMDKEGLDRSLILISPIIHTIREGPQIFQQIRNSLGGDYGRGKFLLEHSSTILPGKQRNYGVIYNNVIGASTDRTKTGTILAPYYIDFGVLGIVFFGLFLGLTNYFLELKSKKTQYQNMIYMFFISFEITWIHGGAPFSPTFILALLFFFLFSPMYSRIRIS
jgi:hypothetical protein